MVVCEVIAVLVRISLHDGVREHWRPDVRVALAAMGDGRLGAWTRRTYKVVRIHDATGAPALITDRPFAAVE